MELQNLHINLKIRNLKCARRIRVPIVPEYFKNCENDQFARKVPLLKPYAFFFFNMRTLIYCVFRQIDRCNNVETVLSIALLVILYELGVCANTISSVTISKLRRTFASTFIGLARIN